MKINKLLKLAGYDEVCFNHEVSMITSDSRSCKLNSVFIAIKGNNNDGNDYILEALTKGARTIISNNKTNLGINNIIVDNPKKALADLLYLFNKNKYKRLKKIGVIGTNGKTSTSTILNGFLNTISKSMLIGSNGCFYLDKFIKHDNTTPNINTIYNYFDIAIKNKIKYIVMEISSIAVIENRVHNIDFDYLIFTNFSLDHLDYHQSLDEYFRAKSILFYSLKRKAYAIINKDDSKYEKITNNIRCKTKEFSLYKSSKYQITDIDTIGDMIEFKCLNRVFRTNLIGEFNLYNLLPTIVMADILKLSFDLLFKYLYQVPVIAGRVNIYEHKNRKIIIDYAHTPKALEEIIKLGINISKGDTIVVVGCGGDRDKSKRSVVGEILSSYNVIPIITSDNPRGENPYDIINDITKNISKEYVAIEDRKEAINHALRTSHEGDAILILGKGEEEFTIIGDEKIYGSDSEILKEYILNDN